MLTLARIRTSEIELRVLIIVKLSLNSDLIILPGLLFYQSNLFFIGCGPLRLLKKWAMPQLSSSPPVGGSDLVKKKPTHNWGRGF